MTGARPGAEGSAVSGTMVRPVRPDDFAAWLPLWLGYLAFYGQPASDAVTQTLWARFFDPAEPVHAFVAERAGALVGITHYLFHRNTWMIEPVCYLQDLFTAPAARGTGAATALVEAVAVAARKAKAERLYWMTHESNATARALYDRIAERSGFIQYRKTL